MSFTVSAEPRFTPIGTWYNWFAWYPVVCLRKAGDQHGSWTWLRRIQRRQIRIGGTPTVLFFQHRRLP